MKLFDDFVCKATGAVQNGSLSTFLLELKVFVKRLKSNFAKEFYKLEMSRHFKSENIDLLKCSHKSIFQKLLEMILSFLS